MKKKKIQFVNYKLKNSQKDISKFIIPKPKNKNIIKKSFTINKKKTDTVSEEQLLEVLYFHLLKVYKSKKYQKVISDIEEKENLLKNNLASFDLLHLKILCYLKEFNYILENELNNPFKKEIGFKPLENQLNKIQEEFKKLLNFANNEIIIHYEKITQLYSKILFCFSLLYRLKDDYTKCLSNIILSLNLLKIFFVKNIKANEIKTYKIYCINILHAISLFIMDNNFKEALKYAYLLLKICEISIKICKLNNEQNKIPNFIDFLYFDFIFTGLCYEFLEDDLNAFEFYKLAFNLRRLLSEKNKRRYLFISINLIERFKEKFDEKEKNKEIQMKEQLKKAKEEKIKRKLKKKNEELFYISEGLTVNPNKYNNFENFLTKKLFNNNNLKKIEKLNDDLVNLVYNNAKFNQTSSSEEKKKKISYETKKNLYNFEIYKNLLSTNYIKFITKNEILEFNNPVKAYDSIKKIQIYLNQQIQKNMLNSKINKKNSKSMKIMKTFRIEKPKNLTKNNESKSNQNIFSKNNNKNFSNNNNNNNNNYNNNNNLNNNNINNNNNNINNNIITTNNNNKNTNNIKILNRTASNYLTSKTNPILFPKNEKKNSLIKNKSFYITSYKNINSRNNNNNNINNNKKNLICLTKNLSNDFEKKNIDKFLLSKNYYNKYMYLDNLSMKELDFQKTILNLKKEHSKGFYKTIKDDFLITKNENEIDEIAYKTFIYLKNKSNDNNNNNIENNIDIINKFQNTNKIKGIFSGIFTGESNRKSVADSFNKVLQKYIERGNKIKKIKMKLEDQDFIKNTNEENLIKINNKIIEINNKIKNLKKK